MNKTDVAVLVVDSAEGLTGADREMLRLFEEKQLPCVLVFNKCDLAPMPADEKNAIGVSAKEKTTLKH